MKRDKKFPKYNFEEMKAAALSSDREVRKNVFCDYFERFDEFPSFLFDNEPHIDARLMETIADLRADQATSEAMRKGITRLLERLPGSD